MGACGLERARVCMTMAARARECASMRVALIIQHASSRHIVICDLSFSTLSHERYEFWEKCYLT